MGRKSVLHSFKMIDAATMVGNITSAEVDVSQLDGASVHISWASSSIVGEIKVEAINGDKDLTSNVDPSSLNWYELDFNDTLVVNVDNSNMQIVFSALPFTKIRLKYVATSGTGSLTATITAKSIGA
jgi:hypothetical protein